MSWYQFRPVEHWPTDVTQNRRSRWTFKAKWRDTLALLENELAWLDAKNVILHCYPKNGLADIRNDGMLRANAIVTRPGVILSFDSKHGPLSYPCDSCEKWQHNVRSIALALQALRAVDRYGVTGRAEQYRGWTKIAEPGELLKFKSLSQAWEFVLDLLNIENNSQFDKATFIRKALIAAHPDNGGTARQFKLAQSAKYWIIGEEQ